MVQLIHNSVKGRARFKIRGLHRNESLKEYLEERLATTEGIENFKISTLTGNALLFYDTKKSYQALYSTIFEYVSLYHKDLNSPTSYLLNKDKKINTGIKTSNHSSSQELKPKRSFISRRKLRKSVIHSEEQTPRDWHLMESEEVLSFFNVERNVGLSSEIADRKLKKYGLNVLPEAVPRSGLSIFFDQFKSLPVGLLGLSAVISLFTGGLADAFIIMGVVCINAMIGYLTESQAEKTIHSLKNLVRPSAYVIRDSKVEHIGAENVVLGDIVILRPGSYVPADARLIEAQNLSVDESLLTGESMPVLKSVNQLKKNPLLSDIPLADRSNMVYMGTLVTGGQGLAVVTATGRFTEIGKVQTLIGKTVPQDTPMEKQLKRLGTQLVLISISVCFGIFFIGLIRGYDILHMLKTSISLAIAAVPEGLPAVATTTLSLGIRNMRRQKVLIRHLNAVETLGCVQTICLDKTGTLTMNKMSVVYIYTGMKRIKVSGGSFQLMDSVSQNINGVHKDHFIKNLFESDELLKLIKISFLCSESEVKKGSDGYIVNGSPTENALIHLAISSGIDVISERERFPMVGIKHRSEKANYMVTIHNINFIKSNGLHPKIVAIKGSPLEVLSLCNFHILNGKKIPLSKEDQLKIELENEKMAGADALRVLGIAYSFIDERKYSSYSLKDFKNNGNIIDNISDLLTLLDEVIWLGLVGISDPIRDGVKELIADFHKAGIDTIMITGDQGPTAYAVGKELNLSKDEPLEILDSTSLADMEPEIMTALCSRVKVFSRASPANKLQIVQALQKTGRVVAMTGDGINDGPALKAADIGIAMGQKSTDVAREVADVVLEDDRMETMIIAIRQGRTIYSNIRKSLHFLLSTNLSEIIVMFSAIALGIGQPLTAMQLLWINLISDIAPGLALALEPPESDVMNSPPRDPKEPIIGTSDFQRIAFESAVLSAGSLTAYGYGIAKYGIGPKASSLAFMTLSTGQILHSLSCRSRKSSIFSKDKKPKNKYLYTAIGGSLALQFSACFIPGLKNLLGISPINFMDGFIIGCCALTPLLINETTKIALL